MYAQRRQCSTSRSMPPLITMQTQRAPAAACPPHAAPPGWRQTRCPDHWQSRACIGLVPSRAHASAPPHHNAGTARTCRSMSTTCGPSSVAPNAVPSSLAKLPSGDSVPLVRMVLWVLPHASRNGSAGSMHHRPSWRPCCLGAESLPPLLAGAWKGGEELPIGLWSLWSRPIGCCGGKRVPTVASSRPKERGGEAPFVLRALRARCPAPHGPSWGPCCPRAGRCQPCLCQEHGCEGSYDFASAEGEQGACGCPAAKASPCPHPMHAGSRGDGAHTPPLRLGPACPRARPLAHHTSTRAARQTSSVQAGAPTQAPTCLPCALSPPARASTFAGPCGRRRCCPCP